MEVEARAPRLGRVSHPRVRVLVPEPAGRVDLVGRLVLGKANVPVDPEHRLLGVTGDFGCRAGEADVELLDQGPHGSDYHGQVDVLVGVSRGPGVVASELLEAATGGGGEGH